MAGDPGARVVLEAAIALGERAGTADRRSTSGVPDGLPPEVRAKVPRWLRDRITGEQDAVAQCMRLAQRSRDELTRALFRQIASDSLRHAEIVASLAAYLESRRFHEHPDGITRADVEQLLEREHAAEATDATDLGPRLGGVMRILWESIESDERKHERLLGLLLEAGLAGPATPRSRDRTGAEGPGQGVPQPTAILPTSPSSILLRRRSAAENTLRPDVEFT